MNSIRDVQSILSRYQDRYLWLDVLASDVEELRRPLDERWTQVGNATWTVSVDGSILEMAVNKEQGVARFRLAPAMTPTGGAITGAALGALLGSAIAIGVSKKRVTAENAVLGLLVGGLAGGAIGNVAARPATVDENRILTLRYDEQLGEWRVYHGPLVNWAKQALRVGRPSLGS